MVGVGDLTGVSGCTFPYGVAVAVPVPRDIVQSLRTGPTVAYYQMYGQLNRQLDAIVTAGETYLRQAGYRAYAQTTERVQVSPGFVSPLPHKTIATRAGLGWIGKSCLLVTKQYGSAIRLSSILTAAPLWADQSVDESQCGKC